MSYLNYSNIPSFKRIAPDDFNITPFTMNKLWQISKSEASSSYGILTYEARCPDRAKYRNGIIPYNDSFKYTPDKENNIDRGLLWYKINSDYFSEAYNSWYIKNSSEKRILYSTASLLTIPTNIIDQQIKHNSFTFSTSSMLIIDDGEGGLIDTTYNTSSFVNPDNLVSYWGFNEKYENVGNSVLDMSLNGNNNGIIYGSVNFTDGILTSGDFELNSGTKAVFDGQSSILIEHDRQLSFYKDDDFAISFWLEAPQNQQSFTGSQETYSIISKRTYHKDLVFNKNKNVLEIPSDHVFKSFDGWPYDISIFSTEDDKSGKIRFSRKGGINETVLTSSIYVTSSQHHILFQKTGSMIELYIDGTKDGEIEDTANGNTFNNASLLLGGLYKNAYGNFSGSLDEVRIYNKGLTTTEISGLSNNDYDSGYAYQTNKVGYIYYYNGNMLVTDVRPKYKNIYSGDWNITFKNKIEMYEYEVICKIAPTEFNMTLNPTIRVNNDENNPNPKSFVTSSSWNPYITTIGLYNNKYELLAIAKTAKPIPKRTDVPINIIVRMDI